jgi:hypothetical protein
MALNELSVGTKMLREKWTNVSTTILGNILVLYVIIAYLTRTSVTEKAAACMFSHFRMYQ